MHDPETLHPRRRQPSALGDLKQRVAALEHLPYAELQSEWRRLFRSQPPKKISRDLLGLAIAWKLQEKALGGLSAPAKRQLATLAQTLSNGGEIARPRTLTMKPGARLMREWNGETHDVLVLNGGFRWRGQHWPSLSAIARAITGTRWSGPRFFGLHQSGKEDTLSSGPRRRTDLQEAIND